MYAPGGHYVKWNNPDIKRHILYYRTYMWHPKKVEFIETGFRMVVTRGWKMREMGKC